MDLVNKHIILFDGVCNLCNAAVNFVIKRDKQHAFHFAPLQSETGKAILAEHNLSADQYNSFIFYSNGKLYSRSTAALQVARLLPVPYYLLYGFIIVPVFIRDAVYNLVARNRYKWWGRQDQCMIPTPALKAKFLN